MAYLPFPSIYIVIAIVLLYLTLPFFSTTWKKKFGSIWKRILIVLSIAIISFYWLWGFNYKRKALKEYLNLPESQPTQEFTFDEYCRVLDTMVELRSQMLAFPDLSEEEIQMTLRSTLNQLDVPHAGMVRARRIRPKGVLLRISTAGVYLPFAGEGHIDAGLHPLTHPFTMAHEMSHGYGWTGEDDCNFIALLTCVNSDNQFIKYSGYFSYWRYLQRQIYRLDKERFNQYYRQLPDLIASDLSEVIAYQDRYPDIFPALRNLIYDNYLKSHGVSAGLVSYSQMIIMSYQWQIRHGQLEL